VLQWRVGQDAAGSRRARLREQEAYTELGEGLRGCRNKGSAGSVSCWKLQIGCHVRLLGGRFPAPLLHLVSSSPGPHADNNNDNDNDNDNPNQPEPPLPSTLRIPSGLLDKRVSAGVPAFSFVRDAVRREQAHVEHPRLKAAPPVPTVAPREPAATCPAHHLFPRPSRPRPPFA
jgi:hypothetical protein